MIECKLELPDSYLVICPWCFDIWARLIGADSSFWWHRYVPCTQHPQASSVYGWALAGSLLETDEPLIDCLPPDLLAREFYLAVENAVAQTT
jgi:hypothetical protein